ncbi:MAG: hypothetical protein ABI426_03790 [Flavobacterium sp.]
MLKKILKLDGALELTRNEQKAIKGALKDCIDPNTNLCKYRSISCAPPCRDLP